MSHNPVRPLLYSLVAGMLVLAGCSHKTVAKNTPPTPPPPPSPTATMHVSPEDVQAGQSATLSWTTANATNISIDGVGDVAASGSKQVSPSQSTSYHLVAKGQGGNADATARLTVNQSVAAGVSPTEEELFARLVKDVYFDYDKYEVRSNEQADISADASFFKEHSNLRFVIEGHCDERGSDEYNIALGDNRAEAAKKQLISMGVDAGRIKVISYGKEKPFCTQDAETCYQQNRRAHFALDHGSNGSGM
ncbi:MAG TPA: peptidoglycan-associated lipoprotein Pal [Candidatus Koribacter sp.]|jgi:peptidoglycan-associated lipoprotein